MNCISPPGLADWQLISYIDDEADDTIRAHIKKCSFCRGEAERWEKVQKSMRRQLYRHNCPSSMDLGEYHLGIMVSASQKSTMANHLQECVLCRDEIARLEEYLEKPDAEAGIVQLPRLLIAKLVNRPTKIDLSLSPSLAGLRGEDDEPITYQVGNVQITIDVQEDEKHKGRKKILGLVMESKEVRVSQGNQIIATRPVEYIGNFVITNLMPGDYEVVLEGSEGEIHIQSIHII